MVVESVLNIFGGTSSSATGEMRVTSDPEASKVVVLVIDGKRWSVNGDELIKAVENARNH